MDTFQTLLIIIGDRRSWVDFMPYSISEPSSLCCGVNTKKNTYFYLLLFYLSFAFGITLQGNLPAFDCQKTRISLKIICKGSRIAVRVDREKHHNKCKFPDGSWLWFG